MVSNSCLQENMLCLQLENVTVNSFVREKAYNSDTQWSLVALKCASKHQCVLHQHSVQRSLKMTPEWELRSHNPVSDDHSRGQRVHPLNLPHQLCH